MLVKREKLLFLANSLAEFIVKSTRQARMSITGIDFLDARYNALLENQQNLDYIFMYLVISFFEQAVNFDFARLVLQTTLKKYYGYEDYMQTLLDDLMEQTATIFIGLEQFIGETINLSAFSYYRKVGEYLVQTSSFKIRNFALNDADTNVLGKRIQETVEKSIQESSLVYDSIVK